jgi:SAM-dependent methyltransferase
MKVTNGDSVSTGLDTLRVISKADRLNQWMFSSIENYCNGEILEIGSGIGNISRYFLDNNYNIFLSDIDAHYCSLLQANFNSYPNLKGIQLLDLANPNFDQSYSHLLNKFNTVFALNVLEHIEDHYKAIQNAYKLLQPGGTLIILVPAYPCLFCEIDRGLGHFRRYTRNSLQKVISDNGLHIKKTLRFNALGIAGWLLFGKILGKKQLEQQELNIYNHLVPIFKFIDILLFRKIGLSLITIASKPAQ